MRVRNLLLPLVLVALLVRPTVGCSPQVARAVAGAAIFMTAVAVIAHHDAHWHSHHCGHPVMYVDGRDAYWYQGHWEYYDEATGRWYRYTEAPPPPQAPPASPYEEEFEPYPGDDPAAPYEPAPPDAPYEPAPPDGAPYEAAPPDAPYAPAPPGTPAPLPPPEVLPAPPG